MQRVSAYLNIHLGPSLQQVQPSRDCVQKTLKRLEDRTQGKVLHQIIYSLISSNAVLQQRTAIALTRLVRGQDLRHVFVDRKGMDVLIDMLTNAKKPGAPQKEAAGELLSNTALPMPINLRVAFWAATAQILPCQCLSST